MNWLDTIAVVYYYGLCAFAVIMTIGLYGSLLFRRLYLYVTYWGKMGGWRASEPQSSIGKRWLSHPQSNLLFLSQNLEVG